MQVLCSRRGGVVTLVVAGAAVAAAVSFAVAQLLDRPAVRTPLPAPGGAVSTARPEISFSVGDAARLGDLRVRIDGRDVTEAARSADDRVVLRSGRLSQGTHEVEVAFSSDNAFARAVRRSWRFEVDTAAPALALARPERGSLQARRAVRFAGTAEPGAQVSVTYEGGFAEASAGEDGRWTAVARLPEGHVAATVTAVDRAGNATERRRRLTVDTTAPALAVASPKRGEQITETDEPLVYGTVASENPRALTFTAAVNGREVATVEGVQAASPDGEESGYSNASGTEASPLEIDGRRFAMAVGTLPQGRNRIVVRAADRAGNVARVTTVVHVDSTEELGVADLAPGARGADVLALQRRLRAARVFPRKGRLGGVLDARTRRAVVRYQKQRGIPRTGVVDARTRREMVGRIVVSLSQRKLRLIRDGRVAKTYRIAIGQPAYPTPTGEYEVNDKQVDPYWYPPDSPWAAELSTIPPGPGNPLGTRWIGTTAPAIGIHGTYAGESIGTAASHGCMRMHIPEVEELYEQVALGMPVSIRA